MTMHDITDEKLALIEYDESEASDDVVDSCRAIATLSLASGSSEQSEPARLRESQTNTGFGLRRSSQGSWRQPRPLIFIGRSHLLYSERSEDLRQCPHCRAAGDEPCEDVCLERAREYEELARECEERHWENMRDAYEDHYWENMRDAYGRAADA